MSALEVVLAASTAVLAAALVVTFVRLRVARRQVARLQEGRRRPDRSRLVPTPTEAVRTVVGTALRVRDQGLGGVIRSSIDDLAQWADVERPDLARLASADGTVTILFSDIEDSTALNHLLGDRDWVRLLARHDRLVKRAVAAHDGHVVKTQGDGFMVAFAEASEAVGAACAIQRALARVRPGRKLDGIRVRVGAHRGSAVHRDNDLFGRNVAIAARVASQADGGEVLVSEAVLAAVGEDALHVLDSREVELKGVPGTHCLHRIDWAAGS
ncbi:adenylate/guanylate cyclase domain-containing protein [Aeromicrobium chenweiae]|uniref:Adenylate/guanylate cyclase domain-containing protein n=1 Tax=Aeromicrobium chenweiae TaxID=2079793 RepID=A0A2S0WJR8_9ACTN|nr:adenylate/guanylate cyclase domain-containing protein [Aeromicrobium chenweiae]AWB91532.1 adenylate/guanylate cyclase domain-containing protein [Aeromicrobium chenweiae]TGN32367.1 adenylate/guanylate cyclase domain-containing protein [Aeromicrobium chenweiae]